MENQQEILITATVAAAIALGTFWYIRQKSRRTHTAPTECISQYFQNLNDPVERVQWTLKYEKCPSHLRPNCLQEKLEAYAELKEKIECIRRSQYDPSLLEPLWRHVQRQLTNGDDSVFSPISPNWKLFGFQGNDPQTDLRSMGMLAIYSLLEFDKLFKHDFEYAFSAIGQTTQQNYLSFGILAVNICSWQWNWLNDDSLKHLVFASRDTESFLELYWRIYAVLFIDFVDYWLNEPDATMLHFEQISQVYKKKRLLPSIDDFSFVRKNQGKLNLV